MRFTNSREFGGWNPKMVMTWGWFWIFWAHNNEQIVSLICTRRIPRIVVGYPVYKWYFTFLFTNYGCKPRIPTCHIPRCSTYDIFTYKTGQFVRVNVKKYSICGASGLVKSLDPTRTHTKWVCLKIGYIPNYSHLIGIMIINHWVIGVHYFQTHPNDGLLQHSKHF